MSTTFRTVSGTWVCTRWAGRRAAQAFDFGSVRQLDSWVEQALLHGDVSLVNEDSGRVETTLLRLLAGEDVSGRHGKAETTFGEFGGTVEVGSGELMDRLGMTGLGDDEDGEQA